MKRYEYQCKYIELKEFLIDAHAEYDLLCLKYNHLDPVRDERDRMALQKEMDKTRVYIKNITSRIEKWGEELRRLGEKYNRVEYEYFKVLIIDETPPAKTNWSLDSCYRYLCTFRKDVNNLYKEKGI